MAKFATPRSSQSLISTCGKVNKTAIGKEGINKRLWSVRMSIFLAGLRPEEAPGPGRPYRSLGMRGWIEPWINYQRAPETHSCLITLLLYHACQQQDPSSKRVPASRCELISGEGPGKLGREMPQSLEARLCDKARLRVRSSVVVPYGQLYTIIHRREQIESSRK